MDNELEGKNILFYSENQNDTLSSQCLEILKNSPLLNEQFYKFSVNNPRIKIPNMIRQQNITPIIAVSGFNELMKGPRALDWIKNNNLNSSKKNEYDYVNIDKGQTLSSSFSSLGDTFKTSSASQNHNSEFNKGTDYADTSYYASVNEKSNIDTYEEQQNNSSKYNQNEKLFNNFKNARQQDLQQINKNMKLDVSNYQQSLAQEETRKPKYEQPAMQYNPNIGNNNAQYEQQQREEMFQKFLHQDSPIQQNNQNQMQTQMHSRQYNPVPQQPMRQGYGGPMMGQNSNNTRKTNQFPSFNNGGVSGFSENSSYASW